MAVKIISEGPDPKIVKEIICRNCGCKLEYVPADERSYQKHCYDGSTTTYYHIVCPKCGKDVITRSLG